MPKPRQILNRRNAIGSIRDVTRTMQMVATARFKRIHGQAVAARPYTDRLAQLVGDLVARGALENCKHPLLAWPEHAAGEVMLVITSDRGLCGGYNNQVLHLAMERMGRVLAEGYQMKLHVVGRRGQQYLRFRNFEVDRAMESFGPQPSFQQVTALTDEMMDAFLAERISGLEVAYMQFVSAGSQKPAIAQILPLSALEQFRPSTPLAGTPAPYEFHPSTGEILEELLPATVRLRMYQCFLDAAVSEQVIRIRSMKAATDNAEEMIRNLTRRYNRTRQSQITTELAEIIGGRSGIE